MTFKVSLYNTWLRASFTSALLLGAMFISPVALSAELLLEEVHTHVERPTEEFVGQSMTGLPLKKMQMQYHVRYDDLDLTSKDDIKTLRKRVTKAALIGCANLGKRTGSLGPSRSCATAAARSANSQVDRAIAQARSMAALRNARLNSDKDIAQVSSDK